MTALDTEVRLYEKATGRLAIVLYLPLDLTLVGRVLRLASRAGLGFEYEVRREGAE